MSSTFLDIGAGYGTFVKTAKKNGFNAFGLQLFAESVAGKADAATFNPFSFKFRNIKITLPTLSILKDD